MSKKLITLALTAVFIILAFFVAFQLLSATPEKYLHFRGGAETKALLIDSQLYYGVYDEDIFSPWDTVNASDPCVVISGTIRNDYDKDYYFAITADVYNSKGESIGPILTSNCPISGGDFVVTHADSGALGTFKIQIKYDTKDIARYDLFLAWQPTEIPPP